LEILLLVDIPSNRLQVRDVLKDVDRVGLSLEDGVLIVDVLEKPST